ncbi:type IV toxin-antitoxin system AbiEi family antitoxin domain-containing protein [Solirubrobacter taibaiensis]|nr:type IV toxin-antitoxin system AbiEi family antitoxin domain-containing protein [Solirubrobacter taibaiensis]
MAARQWGVVDLDDLRACGLSQQAVSKRVAAGRLVRMYQGVWAVGYLPLSLEGRFLAAVLACGPGAALSHWSAVVHWGMREWIEHVPHVTSPALRRQPGIVHHRSEQFERTIHRGIPVTTPVRTICDIAATASLKVLRSVMNQAFGLELVRHTELILYSGRGAKKLRRVLTDAAPTKSELENLVLALIREAGLPRPLVNPRLRGTDYIPDFLWPNERLILEADSRRFHGNMIARADDATRQLVLETMGLRVIRTTWREATTHPAVVQRRIADALSSTSST